MGYGDVDLRAQRIGSALRGNTVSIADHEKHRTNGGRRNDENIRPNAEADGLLRRLRRWQTTRNAAIMRLREEDNERD